MSNPGTIFSAILSFLVLAVIVSTPIIFTFVLVKYRQKLG